MPPKTNLSGLIQYYFCFSSLCHFQVGLKITVPALKIPPGSLLLFLKAPQRRVPSAKQQTNRSPVGQTRPGDGLNTCVCPADGKKSEEFCTSLKCPEPKEEEEGQPLHSSLACPSRVFRCSPTREEKPLQVKRRRTKKGVSGSQEKVPLRVGALGSWSNSVGEETCGRHHGQGSSSR